MKVLIDECAPRALKQYLAGHGHECRTVQEVGWSGKENGELLALAEAAFDVLVTLDTNLQYQQNSPPPSQPAFPRLRRGARDD
jgi:predicted nuclease of predicted toxin-antitoxin system